MASSDSIESLRSSFVRCMTADSSSNSCVTWRPWSMYLETAVEVAVLASSSWSFLVWPLWNLSLLTRSFLSMMRAPTSFSLPSEKDASCASRTSTLSISFLMVSSLWLTCLAKVSLWIVSDFTWDSFLSQTSSICLFTFFSLSTCLFSPLISSTISSILAFFLFRPSLSKPFSFCRSLKLEVLTLRSRIWFRSCLISCLLSSFSFSRREFKAEACS
mmetsp:Transcript_8599/g.25897  ORF Transcript_8599/g.25897 Transcript_8599/m.25897 type:complete len:216 (-) Transcript_8599:1486-2133(-)